MGLRWLLNGALLALPVGATVGVLLGIDSQRHASGQKPLFNSDGSGGSSSGGEGAGNGGGSTDDDRLTSTLYCQQEVGVSPPAKGVHYTLNPNQWGWTPGDPGALCMNITTFNNNTYPTDTTAPAFTVTWAFPPGPETQPVHAFPNVQIDGGDTIPATLSSIQAIDVTTQWSYAMGNEAGATTDVAALAANLLNANVAIDMFIDADKTKAQNSSLAAFEVMVWFADFGASTQPIGLEAGVVSTQVVNGTTFDLYTGKNNLEQTVLTWLAAAATESFTGDIGTLLTQLTSAGNAAYPAATDYLGHISMGSETFSASANVTFSMPVLSIDVQV